MPPTSAILATSLGICLSTAFSIGSLTFSYVVIPAMLLPADAPLLPPLELVTAAKDRTFDTDKAPKQPLDSGVGDKTESILDAGATGKVLRTQDNTTGSPSSSSYLLRQWFHLFSKGMFGMPPCALGSAACYAYCGLILPGPLSLGGPMGIRRSLYLIATLLSAGIMVFTQTVLKPTNTAIHDRIKDVVEQEKESRDTPDIDDKRGETEHLVREWGRINAQRAMMPIVGILCAVAGLVL